MDIMNDSILLLEYKFTLSNDGRGKNHMCRKMGFVNSDLTVVIFPQCPYYLLLVLFRHIIE
jgi:hypothetical protein